MDAACEERIQPFYDALRDVDSRLDVGLNKAAYSEKLGDIRVVYDVAPADWDPHFVVSLGSAMRPNPPVPTGPRIPLGALPLSCEEGPCGWSPHDGLQLPIPHHDPLDKNATERRAAMASADVALVENAQRPL